MDSTLWHDSMYKSLSDPNLAISFTGKTICFVLNNKRRILINFLNPLGNTSSSMHPLINNTCKLWRLQIESGSLLILRLLLMSKYLKCFILAMTRGKVSNAEPRKSKTRKHLNFDRHVFSIASPLAPTAPFGHITVLTVADFLMTKLSNKLFSAKDRCPTFSGIF
ncbi:hypothetical protein V8G54_018016 [Vigna mungo]|uniref:Uncharacterized protein n=1 Tax=Vigna mungo TaxID=3915 RepID=A0AAQ3N858_VIGMU